MHASGRGWASGKLILAGEHAVVHGQPALAFAVSLGTEVQLTRRDGATRIDSGGVGDARLHTAVEQVVGSHGWDVRIRSTLPIGRGMGSSASLSVALVRAARDAGLPVVDDDFAAALPLERVFHGNPSGLDVAVAARGGVLRYRRTDPPETTALACPAWSAVVVDTGKTGDTADLVAGVTARRPAIDATLHAIGDTVRAVEAALDTPATLGPLLTRNHRLLGEIGVSTPELDEIVGWCLEAGALGAKLSGAGGGGVVLALAPDPDPVLAAAERRGYTAWAVRPTEAP